MSDKHQYLMPMPKAADYLNGIFGEGYSVQSLQRMINDNTLRPGHEYLQKQRGSSIAIDCEAVIDRIREQCKGGE